MLVWRVLRVSLHLKAHKLSIERFFLKSSQTKDKSTVLKRRICNTSPGVTDKNSEKLSTISVQAAIPTQYLQNTNLQSLY
jgi:hypothetical protein